MRSQDCCGCVCGRNRRAGAVVRRLLTEARERGAWVGRNDGGVKRHQLGSRNLHRVVKRPSKHKL